MATGIDRAKLIKDLCDLVPEERHVELINVFETLMGGRDGCRYAINPGEYPYMCREEFMFHTAGTAYSIEDYLSAIEPFPIDSNVFLKILAANMQHDIKPSGYWLGGLVI